MQTNRLWLAVAIPLGLLSALWLVSVPNGTLGGDFWSWRKALIYLTGVLALGSMSLGVVLAARPVQVESALGGLDKFYRLHKWFGVTGLSLALVHWLLEVGPRWLTQWGWLVRPARSPRVEQVVTGFGAGPTRRQREAAQSLDGVQGGFEFLRTRRMIQRVTHRL